MSRRHGAERSAPCQRTPDRWRPRGVGDGETLTISGNPALSDLSALSALEIVGDLHVVNNDALTEISGFNALQSLGYVAEIGTLSVQGNDALTDLSPLYGLESVGDDVTVLGNDALPEGEAALVAHIESIGGAVEVQ